jgi:hypothetical protein
MRSLDVDLRKWETGIDLRIGRRFENLKKDIDLKIGHKNLNLDFESPSWNPDYTIPS